jgi:deoxyribose-phosphate aldolase
MVGVLSGLGREKKKDMVCTVMGFSHGEKVCALRISTAKAHTIM